MQNIPAWLQWFVFNGAAAQEYGLHAAIILADMGRGGPKHTCSLDHLQEVMPFLSRGNIRDAIDTLVARGVLVSCVRLDGSTHYAIATGDGDHQ